MTKSDLLTRRLSPLNLLLISVNGMLGSAWLFAPLYVAQTAGPLSLWAWGVGGGMTLIMAWCFAKLSVLYPVTGGTAQLPEYTHGALTGFISGWLGWWSALAMAPIEVQAVLQYLNYFFPYLMEKETGVPVLSAVGMVWALGLMVFLGLVNIWSLKGLTHVNRALFIFKVAVMLLLMVALSHERFYPENFAGGFTFNVSGIQAILSAVSMAGVAFAFTGFKHGVELAGESENPQVAVPVAIMGSVVVCLLLYMGLQIAFMGALEPSLLKSGWSHLSFAGDFGPLAGLATLLGLGLVLKFLYWDAVVSPLGAGLIYTSSTARIVYAMSSMGFLPRLFQKLNVAGLPVYAVFLNLALGLFLFLPFPGWQSLVGFLISGMVLSYGMGPVVLMVLSSQLPAGRISAVQKKINAVLCPVAFYACNLIGYWTGWDTLWKLSIVIALGFVLFFGALKTKRLRLDPEKIGLKSGFWLIPHLGGLTLQSYLGSFGGGLGWIPFGWDFLTMGIFSLVIFYAAVRSSLLVVGKPS